jgi:CubicO group peptidase (beta-lactamase class C family)
MKLSILTTPYFFLLVGLLSCRPKPGIDGYALANKIDSLIGTVPDFSGVLLVADKGNVVYHKAFGFRNFELKIPLDTMDIFELASISKQFTAMIIMMLKEQGKLSFDDSVSAYLPDLPYRGITIRHLLTHTSGLPDYQAIMERYWNKSKIAGNEDNIEYLIRYKPAVVFKPGAQYAYSNTGYMLLATIAEKTSGEDFVALCRNWIFSPLNMTNADIRTPEEKRHIRDFALGYLFVAEKQRYISADSFPEFNYTIWLGHRKGPGRISATAMDLLKWDRALYTERLVKSSTLSIAFSPVQLTSDSISAYGFGWVISHDDKLGRMVYHTGDNPGYKTEIIRYIDAEKTIILLNNNAHEKKGEIIAAIKKMISAS